MSTPSYGTTGTLLLKGSKSPIREKDLKAWLAGNVEPGEYYVSMNGLNSTISPSEIMCWSQEMEKFINIFHSRL